jgi:hypothetical protein
VRLGILERVVRRAQVGIEVGLASTELLDGFFELVNPLPKLERLSAGESSIALKPLVGCHATHLFNLVVIVPLNILECLLESVVRLILYRLEFGHPVIGVHQLVLPLKQRFAEVLDVLLPTLEFLHPELVLSTVAWKRLSDRSIKSKADAPL